MADLIKIIREELQKICIEEGVVDMQASKKLAELPQSTPASGLVSEAIAVSEEQSGRITKGQQGDCYKNVQDYLLDNDIPDAEIIHGEVTSKGKTVKHAWIETQDIVYDPTTGVKVPREKYYQILNPRVDARYSFEIAMKKRFSEKNFGPWTEGVADRYAEKAFNIPDPNVEMNQKALQAMPEEDINGTFVGSMSLSDDDNQEKMILKVYLNPRELKNFDANVRAVSNDKGDLFVAQNDLPIFHQYIVDAVNETGVYRETLNRAYSTDHNITWHRIGNRNIFGLSSSYIQFLYSLYENDSTKVDELISEVQRKNPQFKFIKQYWDDVKYYGNSDVTEGVADRYAEKAFNIPDPNVEMNRKVQQQLEKPFKVMTIKSPAWLNGGKTEQIAVYLNPRSLQNFGSYVRAITCIDGNLYVAQTDGDFVHGDMAKELGLTETDTAIYTQMYKFQLLHRIGNDNAFGLADSSAGFIRQDENSKKASIKLLRAAKAKNPQFEYYPEYYQNVDAYDTDPIDANGNDIYDEETYDEDNIGDDNFNSGDFNEGVADRYAEKEFNIPDERKQQDIRALTGLQKEKEKPFAFIGQTPVFKNPKSLENFRSYARAIADENGDVYIEQAPTSLSTHGIMGEKIGLVSTGMMIYRPEFLLLHYDGNNDFIFSDSSITYYYSNNDSVYSKYREEYLKIIQRVKIKNPDYNIMLPTVDDKDDEELNELLNKRLSEDLADIARERLFNVKADDGSAKTLKHLQRQKETPVGSVGYMSDVYLNPLSLNNFDKTVRAVGDINGNLYVAQHDGDFTHVTMMEEIGVDIWRNDNYLRLVRSGNNSFSLSDGLTGYSDVNAMLMKLKQKNPQYSFNNKRF